MKFVGKAKGRVIRWDAEKKFGFSKIDEILSGDVYKSSGMGEDAFVHHREVNMEGVRKLIPGQIIQFEMFRGPKGITAKEVVVVGEAYDDEGEINGNV
jgi:cold shock CspA family protein